MQSFGAKYLNRPIFALFFGDILLFFLAWNLSYFLRFHFLANLVPVLPGEGAFYFHRYLLTGFFLNGVQIFIFTAVGLYETRFFLIQRAFSLRLLWAVFLCLTFWFAVLFFYRSFSYSRLHALYFIFTSLCFLGLYRLFLYAIFERGYFFSTQPRSILIYGTGELAKNFWKKLQKSNQKINLSLAGFVGKKADFEQKLWLGEKEQLAQILEQKKISEVVIVLDCENLSDFKFAEKILQKELIDVTWALDADQNLFLHPEISTFQGIPIITALQSPLEGLNILWKRMFDFFVSAGLIVLFSPLWVILPLLILMDSRGGIFYRQERMGLDGKVFKILKFRSMVLEAEVRTGAVWAKRNDPRITKLGKFLRKTSLDEFPQFFNVLKGDMSLVGPRPERPELIEKFRHEIPFYMARHRVKAGISGWAQVNGLRGNTSLEKRIEFDLYYMRHWSFLFDLKILFFTFFKGFVHKNAY